MAEPLTVEQLIAQIEQFPDTVKQAIQTADDTAQLVDVLGTAHVTAAALGRLKRKWASEVENGDHGDRFGFKQGKEGDRTYNTMALVLKLQEKHGGSALAALMWLIEEDIVRLSWQWSNLEKICIDYNIPLRSITRDEPVENGDPDYDVGVRWKPASPSYPRVKETDV